MAQTTFDNQRRAKQSKHIYPFPAFAVVGVALALLLNGFFESTWSQCILAASVIVNLLTLGYKATKWRGFRPLLYGIVGALLIFMANTNDEARMLELIGVAALVLISLWTAWPPKNPGAKPPCCQ